MADRDVDAVFAEIVAHWDDSAKPAAPPDGDDRGRQGPPADPGSQERDSGRPDARITEPDGQPATAEAPWPVWRGALVPADEAEERAERAERAEVADAETDDAHFEPGPLAPLPPTEDLHFWGIVVGLVVGPLLLIWLVIFRPDVTSWWAAAAVVLTVGGFALLVLRQPATRDEDDPDNGARI